jgi:hypothetical protein
MRYLTSSNLIASVKRKLTIPDDQTMLSDADILAFCNEEMKIGILPTVLAMQEEYLVYSKDIPLVSGVSKYSIPYRALSGKLRDVFYKDNQGNLVEMTRLHPNDAAYFQSSNASGSSLRSFYIQNDSIVVVPDVGTNPTGSISAFYYITPNELVDESRVATITAITVGASTTVFTLASIPTGMTSTSLLDIMQTNPGHKIREYDLTSTAISVTLPYSVTFNNTALPSGTEVGDYISFAGESIIPQVPPELHPVLAQRVAARCAEALGDVAALQAANLKLVEMDKNVAILIDNRVEGATLKVNNIHGLLRSGKNSRRRGF